MTGNWPRPGVGDQARGGGIPLPVAESRLVAVGIHVRRLAAAAGIPADCVVHVDASMLPMQARDGHPIWVVDAHLRLPEPDEAALLAAALWLPAVPRRSPADDWCWRGWLTVEAPNAWLVSVTLSSPSGGAVRQGPARGAGVGKG
ncbi:hypothetical protein C8K30_1011099 [Promicromonospora sp. AC04]|nr:hypothetical protein C8K30_1011099 [Promicromonospora sp. AC04]